MEPTAADQQEGPTAVEPTAADEQEGPTAMAAAKVAQVGASMARPASPDKGNRSR